MKKTLYIVSRGPDQGGPSLLPSLPPLSGNASVVLIQDGLKHRSLPYSRVFALLDDEMAQEQPSPFPPASYQSLLRMIFEADNVAVL